MPPSASSEPVTAAWCRWSARPAPARPGWSRSSSRSLCDDPIVLSMSASPYSERNVWGPVAGGISSLFGLPAEVDADDVRDIVEARAGELWQLTPGDAELERYLTAVLHVLGLPSELDRIDPAGATDKLAAIVADMVRRHAQTRMTVLWFDNLQWAQPTVRKLIAVAVRSLLDLPFLLVTAQRPDDAPQWPPPELDRPLVVRLPLGPLADARGQGARAPRRRAGGPRPRRRRRDRRGAGGARRRQPAVPRRARRGLRRPAVGGGAQRVAAGADRVAPRPVAAGPAGDRRQRRRARRHRPRQGARALRPASWARPSTPPTSPRSPPTGSSRSATVGGASTARSSARSPTRP